MDLSINTYRSGPETHPFLNFHWNAVARGFRNRSIRSFPLANKY
jgi:hypothetical protein